LVLQRSDDPFSVLAGSVSVFASWAIAIRNVARFIRLLAALGFMWQPATVDLLER
jgi:hypothetical protein